MQGCLSTALTGGRILIKNAVWKFIHIIKLAVERSLFIDTPEEKHTRVRFPL